MNLQLVAAGAALAIAFGAGWGANGWRKDAEIDRIHASHARSLAAANSAALALQKRLDAAADDKRAALAQLDAEGSARLKDAQNENDRMRRCIVDGTCGLRVRTVARSCPADPVPSIPDASGVDHGAGAELDPTARQDYFTLREAMSRVHAKLAACQAAHRINVQRPLE